MSEMNENGRETPWLVMAARAEAENALLALPLEADWLLRRIRQYEALTSFEEQFGDGARMLLVELGLVYAEGEGAPPRTYLDEWGGTGVRAWEVRAVRPAGGEAAGPEHIPTAYLSVGGIQWSVERDGRVWRSHFVPLDDLLALHLLVAPSAALTATLCSLLERNAAWARGILAEGLPCPDGSRRDVTRNIAPDALEALLEDMPGRFRA